MVVVGCLVLRRHSFIDCIEKLDLDDEGHCMLASQSGVGFAGLLVVL